MTEGGQIQMIWSIKESNLFNKHFEAATNMIDGRLKVSFSDDNYHFISLSLFTYQF